MFILCEIKTHFQKLLVMKTTNYMVALATTFSVLIGCKDSASRHATEKNANSLNKKEVVALKPETITLRVDGMSCAVGCAKTIESKLSNMDGVQKATVNFDKKQAIVEFDASVISIENISRAIESTGDGETYKATAFGKILK